MNHKELKPTYFVYLIVDKNLFLKYIFQFIENPPISKHFPQKEKFHHASHPHRNAQRSVSSPPRSHL